MMPYELIESARGKTIFHKGKPKFRQAVSMSR